MELQDDIIVKQLKDSVHKCGLCRNKGENTDAYKNYIEGMESFKLLASMEKKYGKILTSDIMRDFYILLQEFTIFAFYVNKCKDGLELSDQLLLNRIPDNIINKNLIARNQSFYMSPLSNICIDKKLIKIKCEKHYNELNPSIISTDDGYIMNCRTSNFGVKPGGIYYTKTEDGIVNTKNYILELDNNFNIKSQVEVIDFSRNQRYPNNVIGLEDVIIFKHQGELWCTCTTLDTNPQRIPQISLCKLEYKKKDDNNIDSKDVYEINIKNPLRLLTEDRCEKNWLPFSHDNQIKFIYSYSPTQIITPRGNILKGDFMNTDILISNNTKLNFERFRGSGGPVMLSENNKIKWLTVVHEVSWSNDNSRIYTHRFVVMNDIFDIIGISDPWYFENRGIEFCRSMCLKDDILILTCGLKDEEAWCYIIRKDKVISMIRNLDDFDIKILLVNNIKR